jgi:hypothetical protein
MLRLSTWSIVELQIHYWKISIGKLPVEMKMTARFCMVLKYFPAVLAVLMILFEMGCRSQERPSNSTPIPFKAIYLVQGQALLSSRDLQIHPEIILVKTFNELEQYSHQKVALWIDKGAVSLMQQDWLNTAPQAYYPIVLIGYSDTLYSFRDLLGLCCFAGPAPGENDQKLKSGFSIIERTESSDPTLPTVTFLKGYDQIPTVQAILDVTNALLEAGLKTPLTP